MIYLALVLMLATSDMVWVPSGPFMRGCIDVVGCSADRLPAHVIYLDGFWIDRTEVSAEDYAAFLNDVGNPGRLYWENHRGNGTRSEAPTLEELPDGTYAALPGYERYPANQTQWYGADEYCRWAGKRLPTEAEWEKAARGTDGRNYPWGSTDATPVRARYLQDTVAQGADAAVPVDALPLGASPYGALNMAGNVWEWTADWYDPHYYANAPSSNPPGPVGPTTDPAYKVMRGGEDRAWPQVDLRTDVRTPHEPFVVSSSIGFRCVVWPH